MTPFTPRPFYTSWRPSFAWNWGKHHHRDACCFYAIGAFYFQPIRANLGISITFGLN